jgi:hypothetical protein
MEAAAEYPFLNILGTMASFFLWTIWIIMMVQILSDVFRRGDLSGGAKVGWTVFMLVLPFIGALIALAKNSTRLSDRRYYGQVKQADFSEHSRRWPPTVARPARSHVPRNCWTPGPSRRPSSTNWRHGRSRSGADDRRRRRSSCSFGPPRRRGAYCAHTARGGERRRKSTADDYSARSAVAAKSLQTLAESDSLSRHVDADPLTMEVLRRSTRHGHPAQSPGDMP